MRQEIPFTNEIGQVIQPGDEVVVVTHCTGSTKVRKGIYVGLYGKSVQAKVPSDSYAYFVKGSNERAPANFSNRLWNCGLKYNTPEFEQLREEVYAPYEYRKSNELRITTLQQNRIYKLG